MTNVAPIIHPRNMYAETAFLGLAMTDPSHTIPEALKRGLSAADFGWPATFKIWELIIELHGSGAVVDPLLVISAARNKGVLKQIGGTDAIDRLTESVLSSPVNARVYVENIVDCAIRREAKRLLAKFGAIADDQDEDVQSGIGNVTSDLQKVATRLTRMRNPEIGNPADSLAVSRGWHTFTGLRFIDRWMALVSEEIHFLAGDPTSGKTTLFIHIAAHNVQNGVPTVIISAETDELEIQLSMLTMTREVNAAFVSAMRHDSSKRTPINIQKIRELWDKHYGDCPLQIHKVNSGADEVVSIVAGIMEPSLILIDHAFAVIAQTETSAGMREHQQFLQFFARTLVATKRNNHITIMANQYTKEGRKEIERGPDAQYGGSGVQNIAGSMTHLWHPGSDITAAGYHHIVGKFVKVRAKILVDEQGRMIDPQGKPLSFYIENKYRIVVDKIPVV